jgi:hypothetical protein
MRSFAAHRARAGTPDVRHASRTPGRSGARARELGASNQMLQAKLRIGAIDDPLEHEADRMADRVMRGAHATSGEGATGLSHAAPAVQRVSAEVSPREEDAIVGPQDEEAGAPTAMRKETMARSNADAPAHAPAAVAGRVDARRGQGTPLSAPVRSLMEQGFGADFGAARLHADAEAAALADAVRARAFTVRNDIYFAAGEYRPALESGRRLIAHELAHVVQQGAAPSTDAVRRAPASGLLQRMSAPISRTRENVHPWRDDISGANENVQTDGGSVVSAWEAYSPWQYRFHYWCHGLSLGTFARYRYSVYSGPPMAQVVSDEWQSVASSNARAGDIAVWLPNYDHSAIFTSVSLQSGQLDENNSRLNTKNGQAAQKNDTLSGIRRTYPQGTPAVFRHK